MPRARRLPQTEDLHRGAQQGGEQVPASLLQPIEEQHGRSEATEEAEDEKSYPVKKFLAKLSYKNNNVLSAVIKFPGWERLDRIPGAERGLPLVTDHRGCHPNSYQ